MATVVSTSGIFTEIITMNGDYDMGAVRPIHSIKFYPGAANDEIRVFHGSVSGPEACKLKSADGEPRVEYFDGNEFQPVIDYSECTLNAGHKIVIVYDRRRK